MPFSMWKVSCNTVHENRNLYQRDTWGIGGLTCYDHEAVRRSRFVVKSIKIPKTLDADSYPPLRDESLDSRGECLISRDKLLDHLKRYESHLTRG